LPMSNDPVATFLDTDEGELPFQRYFVERRCQPVVHQVRFEGAAHASALPAAIEAICDPATSAIMIAPSNPWLSVDPLLSVPGMREALRSASAPIVAISPIVGGQAVKGPTTKLMAELGLSISNETIADHYADFLDAMLVDVRDGMPIVPVACAMANTLMQSLEDRARVARAALDLAAGLDR
jgi:LPPG:FO 2-phospho-L-lactate transferase